MPLVAVKSDGSRTIPFITTGDCLPCRQRGAVIVSPRERGLPCSRRVLVQDQRDIASRGGGDPVGSIIDPHLVGCAVEVQRAGHQGITVIIDGRVAGLAAEICVIKVIESRRGDAALAAAVLMQPQPWQMTRSRCELAALVADVEASPALVVAVPALGWPSWRLMPLRSD